MRRALTFMAILTAGITLANPAQWATFDDHYFAARVTAGARGSGGYVTNYTENGTNFTAHIFTNVGVTNFTVTGGGLDCEVLIVAGGGGGGYNLGGGGGGGGVTNYYATLQPGTNAVVVGIRGTNDANGGNSTFGANTVTGGGKGAAGGAAGAAGGSGGGGGYNNNAGGAGTAGQGNDGGGGNNAGGKYAGGGGGGYSEAGETSYTAASPSYGGNGGEGFESSMSGETRVYGSGGGGSVGIDSAGASIDDSHGLGGTGAGNGSTVDRRHTPKILRANSAATFYGCGGGGGGWDVAANPQGQPGFQGVVIVRYKTP